MTQSEKFVSIFNTSVNPANHPAKVIVVMLAEADNIVEINKIHASPDDYDGSSAVGFIDKLCQLADLLGVSLKYNVDSRIAPDEKKLIEGFGFNFTDTVSFLGNSIFSRQFKIGGNASWGAILYRPYAEQIPGKFVPQPAQLQSRKVKYRGSEASWTNHSNLDEFARNAAHPEEFDVRELYDVTQRQYRPIKDRDKKDSWRNVDDFDDFKTYASQTEKYDVRELIAFPIFR